jgi:hypothetical protein
MDEDSSSLRSHSSLPVISSSFSYSSCSCFTTASSHREMPLKVLLWPCVGADTFISFGMSFLGLLQELLGQLIPLADGNLFCLKHLLHRIQLCSLCRRLMLLRFGPHLEEAAHSLRHCYSASRPSISHWITCHTWCSAERAVSIFSGRETCAGARRQGAPGRPQVYRHRLVRWLLLPFVARGTSLPLHKLWLWHHQQLTCPLQRSPREPQHQHQELLLPLGLGGRCPWKHLGL